MSDEYEIDDLPCPKCGHPETRSQRCTACDDGFHDLHDEDAVNFAPGEAFDLCDECSGNGIVRWCPKCGADYWAAKFVAECNEEREALAKEQGDSCDPF